MRRQIQIYAVIPLDRFRVRLELTDNTRELELEPCLWGPLFEPLRNARLPVARRLATLTAIGDHRDAAIRRD